MNPEFDSTRQALEARLTALLLGELDPDQARALNEIIARDPELSKLHARLKQTIELVRETAVEHAGHNAPATVPLKLSEQRRQELLQRFKTVTPKEFAEPKKRTLRVNLVLVAAMVVVVGLLAAIFLPTQRAFRSSFTQLSETKHPAAPSASSPVTISTPATPQSPPESLTLDGSYVVTAAAERGLGTVHRVATTPIVLPPVENATPLTPLIAPGNQSVAFAVPRSQENSLAGRAGDFGWQPQSAATAGGAGGGGVGAGAPSVVMDDVKLRDAIQDLAHKAGREYTFDPSLDFNRTAAAPDAKTVPEPTVSMHWDNTTPDQALDGLLRNHNLKLVEDPNNKSVGKIVPSGVTTLAGDKVDLFKVAPTKTETAAKPSGGGSVLNFANAAPLPAERTAVSEGTRRGDGTVPLAYQSPGAALGIMATNSGEFAFGGSANPNDLELFRSRYGLAPAAPARPNPNQTAANTQTKVQDGKLLFEMGRLNEAEVALKSAVEADPNNNQAQYYLNLTKDARLKNELASREKSAQVSMLQNENAWTTPHKGVGFDWNGSADINSRSIVDGGFTSNPAPAWKISGATLRGFYDDAQAIGTLERQKREPAVAAGEAVTGLPPGGKVLVGSGAVDRTRLQSEASPSEKKAPEAVGVYLGNLGAKAEPAGVAGTLLADSDQLKSMREGREVNSEAAAASHGTEKPKTLPEAATRSGFSLLGPLPGEVAQHSQEFGDQLGRTADPNTDSFSQRTPVLSDLPTVGGLFRSEPSATDKERGRLDLPNGPVKSFSGVIAGVPPLTNLSTWALAETTQIPNPDLGFLGPTTNYQVVAGIGGGRAPVASPNVESLADTTLTAGVETNSYYDRNTFYRNLGRLADDKSGAANGTFSPDEKTVGPRYFTGVTRSHAASISSAVQDAQSAGQGPSNVYSVDIVGYTTPKPTSNIVLPGSEPTQLARTEKQVMQYANGRDITPSLEQLAKPAETPAPAQSYARTQDEKKGSGRQTTLSKLEGIRLNGANYAGLPLGEVINNLNEEIKKRDPEKRGINFIINNPGPGAVDPAAAVPVDPATGLPVSAVAPEPLDVGAITVKTNLGNKELRLVDALDAIVKASGKPIKYSVEDNGVVISSAAPKKEADEPPKARPAVPPPIPQPEIVTRENAWSTFSLNVSDVSFKLAGASLEKGQLPDPASIRSEEFINAFDYRDPEPSAGIPVAFAWERAQYPFAQNRDLLRLSLKTAAQGRQPGRPLNIVLLLDNSGSMERADRVQIIREALKVLAAQLQPQDKFSLVTFARTPRLLVDGVPGDQAAPVADEVSGLTPQGGTNLEEAMNLAYQTATRHYLANGVNRVVLLTDGAANLGDVKPESLKQKVEAQRKQGIALDCFGIGWEGFNDDLLEVLSRNGDGRYGFINTPGEAATEFAGQLAGALQVAASDVKVQVEFNPARVTAYRQIGYAKHQLTKEQFRDNTVDAAEIGAAEAGNALYTVEVNPAGEGPLATVRVRYKVPGTSDYREQEWAVPYAGAAPALGQASSAMRLAASASAFSEWLATSPYAGDVNPDQLLAYLTGVPEVYGADARPKRLEWMIRQAKSLAGK